MMTVWLDFLTVMCLVQVSGTCFAKAVFSVMATVSVFVPVKAAMVSVFLLSTQYYTPQPTYLYLCITISTLATYMY